MEIPNKGSLTEISFIEILKDSAYSRLTGMIRLEAGVTIKVVYLQQGNIAFASSNEKNDRLTEVLKRAGKLTPEQIEHAQERLKPNVSLGKTLVELGYISARDLLWGARMQVEGILYQLLFWNSGSYQVIEGPLPREIVSLGLSIPSIIFEGIRQTNDRHWVLLHIGSPEAIYDKTPAFDERNAEFSLPVDQVADRMDGQITLHEIASAAGLDTFEVCKIVAAMQVLELAMPVPVKQPAPPVIAEEVKTEELNEIASEVPESDVSLGQVLQIPTVEELQTAEEEPEPEEYNETVAAVSPEPVAEEVQEIVDEPSWEAEAEPVQKVEDTEEVPPSVHIPRPDPMRSISFTSAGSEEGSSGLRKLLIASVIVILIAGAGAYYFWQSRPTKDSKIQTQADPQPNREQSPEPLQNSTPQNDPAPVETPRDESPADDSQQIIQPEISENSKPEPVPDPARKTAAISPMEIAQSGKLPEAASQWRSQLLRRRNRLTIQVEIACQESTVMDAIQTIADPDNVFVVPINFRGQSCYRVLYGIFPNGSQAEAALTKLPAEFLNQTSPPQIISISKVVR